MRNTGFIKCMMIVCILILFAGCKKEKNLITEYVGMVVEENTMNPLPNVKVSVTDGTRVIASTMTDEAGLFSFLVNFEKVTENDSLFLDGSPFLPYQKRFALKGMGQEQYNYGTLILGNGLKTFQYAETTYYVHPEVGTMNWESAMAFCDNLVYAGYSDWFLPDKEELNAMYIYRNSIGEFITTGGRESCYWSSTVNVVVNEGSYFCYQYFDTGMQSQNMDPFGCDYYRVRPIRKD